MTSTKKREGVQNCLKMQIDRQEMIERDVLKTLMKTKITVTMLY